MMIRNLLLLSALLLVSIAVVETQDQGNDLSAEDPPVTEALRTVYEAMDLSPQNMDYDLENNMFIAHSGWYNDHLIHYYKFRMYTPTTYPGLIDMRSSSSDVPIQALYIVTTTGDINGAIGLPIIAYHTSDGNDYSDFMEIVYVWVPDNFLANTWRSLDDITARDEDIIRSGVYVNLPVVPTGATLQDPHKGGTNKAPISPTIVWYKGTQVQTYVFEITDHYAALYFSSTRQNSDPSYSIAVVPSFVKNDVVVAAPVWHVNQFSRGVIVGSNGGGPSLTGMRNIINLDRGDDGYSPLWQVLWATNLPINYEADEASRVENMTSNYAFSFVQTPIFVNCPNIGKVDSTKNPKISKEYQTEIFGGIESNWIMGSDVSLIMQPNVTVSFRTDDDREIGTTLTNMMGAYEYELMSADIPAGSSQINVVISHDVIIRTVTVKTDYINEVPLTVYEEQQISSQNMDFDPTNNMFIAHSGWHNDKLIHYYKFRLYTPTTYPDVITVSSSVAPRRWNSDNFPIQDLFVVTTTGNLEGAVGHPIIQFHSTDGIGYSDFMEINYVVAPDNYTANTFRSIGDIMASGTEVISSGVIVNLPVVPTGSTLQHPGQGGTSPVPISATPTGAILPRPNEGGPSTLPILPTMVWYRGVKVQTYAFEVTDQHAADYFASTRPNVDSVYGVTVVPFASPNSVIATPIWHLNQFTRGVIVGSNGGGPSPAGMRNIITLDREDEGYSPLWKINWVTALPINYMADDASNIANLTAANGFVFEQTPMFVNSPNIGDIDSTVNAKIANDFQREIDVSKETNWVMGSLIMDAGVTVSFQTNNGMDIGTTKTNMMGAYMYPLQSPDIPVGATHINVMINDEIIREIPLSVTVRSSSGNIIFVCWKYAFTTTLALVLTLA